MAYSPSDTKISIRNEKNITAEDIVKEANVIWEKCKKRFATECPNPADQDAASRMMDELRAEHKDFCMSYPIVYRYMVQMRVYKPTALAKYLKRIAANPWHSEDEYLASQVDYIIILYKETKNHWDKNQVTQMRATLTKMLKDERDQFKRYYDEFQKEVETEASRHDKEARDEFKRWLEKKAQDEKPELDQPAQDQPTQNQSTQDQHIQDQSVLNQE